jgi:hypothetical protein
MFVAIFKNKESIPKFKESIDLLKWFIDDAFGIWQHLKTPWTRVVKNGRSNEVKR